MIDYEQKYKEALERARISRLQLLDIGEEATEIEHIFPELKESEDERIRKALIKSYTNKHSSSFPTVDGFSREQILAWLEKQGEQKPTWSEEDERMVFGLTSTVEDWYNSMSEKEKEYYGDCGYINWLKSLKERINYKNNL